MESNEIASSKDGVDEGVRNYSKSSDGFIDRSKVRILLCDNDSKDSEEVFILLCKCSYQVISVRSPRQVIDALNAEGPGIDIILSEVDLPMAKGLKMLKYIMRDKELQHIPVIMMSTQHEVSVVVEFLKLGAADYLVKPLRTNELLNLWTHMWRRRRMLGLEEKNMLSYDLDPLASDPRDANTNSTKLFSEDTDDKSLKSYIPETCVSTDHQDEIDSVPIAAPIETSVGGLRENRANAPGSSPSQKGHISTFPKKNELKIGESSAFFTYVKSNALKIDRELVPSGSENNLQCLRIDEKLDTQIEEVNSDSLGNGDEEAEESQYQGDEFASSNITPDSLLVERSCTPPPPPEFSHQRDSNIEGFSGFNPHTSYPYYISGIMNQFMMPLMYQNTPTNTLPQYNQYPHCPQMAPFPYYPIRVCLPPAQIPTEQPWPSSYGSSSSTDGKSSKFDRREAALLKFRQKRKERCFDKKIRYINRKRLVEKRPRVRAQFVGNVNGLNVDLNGQPNEADYNDDEDEEDYDEDEEVAARDSSPGDD